MRTKDAITGASGVWVTFSAVFVLYVLLGVATVIALRAMARRWREADEAATSVPSRAARTRPGPGVGRMSKADACAVVLWVGVTLYAVFGGADFGAGFWSLIAGSERAGPASAAPDRLGDRPGLGGESRLADLHPRRPLDGVLGRLRGDLLDAVHPAQPRRARDRPARLRVRIPRGGQEGTGRTLDRVACSGSRRS